MGNRLTDVPWWVWSLIYLATFGSVRLMVTVLEASDATDRALVATAGGAAVWAACTPVLVRLNRRANAAVGDLSPAEAAAAGRAALLGPVPADARVRAAAHRLAAFRRRENLRGRGALTALFGLTVLGCLVGAVAWTPLWAIAALPLMTLAGYAFWLPVHLHRRMALLHRRTPDTPPALPLGPVR